MEEVVKEFLLESHENLDLLDQDFVELEKRPTRETLASIFRVIHTIKGTCGFLGFAKLESITHVGEGLLGLLREGGIQVNARITDSLLAMVDAVREVLANIESTGREGNKDYSGLIEVLRALQQDGQNLDFSTPPTPLGEILVAQGRIREEELDRALKQQASGDTRHIGEILVAQGCVTEAELTKALQAQRELKSVVLDGSVRVDLALLDKLVNLVQELVLCRNQIRQFATTQQDPTFLAVSQSLNLITGELQAEIMRTRMRPIAQVWSKFPRLVRDLAESCGKHVRIEMEGLETDLDRTVIEAIKDPLTHIVRNAVDHGIEPPEVRISTGKGPEGCLLMRAYHGSGQVHIEITDDGAGINQDKVIAKAVERGLLTCEQAASMGENEWINLIFLPGFSTADSITNLSGRGVGMEIVKNSIEKIGGTVEIQSRIGKGTTVRIKIPLTLAIIPALIVTTGSGRYAVPEANLLEILTVDANPLCKSIEWVLDAPVYRLRGKLLPLVYLSRELGLREKSKRVTDASVNILVIQADNHQFGLVVDAIHDTGEIVVKPLGQSLRGISVFSGATILGDGKVALILDVSVMVQRLRDAKEPPEDGRKLSPVSREETTDEHRAFLIALLGNERRVGIPLSPVARLEEFSLSAIERSGLRQVVQYHGTIMPLIHLSDALGEKTSAEKTGQEKIQVVVCRNRERTVGLIVDRIVNVVEGRLAIGRNDTLQSVHGSALIQGRVTDLLDVRSIIESVDPGFFDHPEAA